MMKHKKKSKGVLESPLFVSLLHLMPSLLLVGGTVLGIYNLVLKVRSESQVLGTNTDLPQMESETVEKRLEELQEAAKRFNSEQLEKAIEKLSVK